MLRKLFISLLILSALTSKGAANNILNTFELLSPGAWFNLSGDLNLPAARLTGGESSQALEAKSYSIRNTVVPLEEILKKGGTGSNSFSIFTLSSHDISYMPEAVFEPEPFIQKGALLVSCSSGVSPPNIFSL